MSYKDRVREEARDLTKKVRALQDFIDKGFQTEDGSVVDAREETRLMLQIYHMEKYLIVLLDRINMFSDG